MTFDPLKNLLASPKTWLILNNILQSFKKIIVKKLKVYIFFTFKRWGGGGGGGGGGHVYITWAQCFKQGTCDLV